MALSEAEAKKLRAGLLDQLGHLQREMEGLRRFVDRIPEGAVQQRPRPDEPSLTEVMGDLIRRDEDIYPDRLQLLAEGGEPTFGPVEVDGLDEFEGVSLEELIDRLVAARVQLREQFEGLDAASWLHAGSFEGEAKDAYFFAHAIAQHDVEQLRIFTHRLFDVNLSDRAQGLPR